MATLPIGKSVYAESNALTFSGECTYAAIVIEGGELVKRPFTEAFSMKLDTDYKRVKLSKIEKHKLLLSPYVEYKKEALPDSKEYVAIGYEFVVGGVLVTNKTFTEQVIPGAKIAFHQQIWAGQQFDCFGIVELRSENGN